MGLKMPSSVTAFDMPLVPLTLFHGIGLIEVPIKIYPGKRGVLISKNLPFFFVVVVISGKKTLKPCHLKFSQAVIYAFGFV